MQNERIQRVITLSGELATEVEKSGLVSIGIIQQIDDTNRQIVALAAIKKELKEALSQNTAALSVTTQRIDDALAALYAPTFKEVAHETVAPEAETESGKTIEAAAVLAGAAEPVAERERFPCLKCGGTFYKREWLENHSCLPADELVRKQETVEAGQKYRAELDARVNEIKDQGKAFESELVRENAEANGALCFAEGKDREAPDTFRGIRLDDEAKALWCKGWDQACDDAMVSVCSVCVSADCGEREVRAHKSACPDFAAEPDADQVAWRDTTCQEWRECLFVNKCFGPSNGENPTCFKEDKIRELGEGALAAEKLRDQALQTARAHRMKIIEDKKAKSGSPSLDEKAPACWNSTCAWGDLAQTDHCDADAQFRQGRLVTECGCLVTGDAPAKGQDGAGCINFECDDNRCQQGCNALEEPWTCERYYSAAWGPAAEVETEPVDQRSPIVRAAMAAGDDINEYGAFLHPERVDIPMPPKCGHSAYINIATASDGSFYMSANHTYPNGGSGGPPFIAGKNYRWRLEAILSGIAEIREKWLKTEKGTKRTKAIAALGDFVKSINSSTPPPAKEQPKQDEAQQEAAAQGTDGDGDTAIKASASNADDLEPEGIAPVQSLRDRLKAAQENPCKHPMDQHKDKNGATVCGVCSYVLKEAPLAVCGNRQCASHDIIPRDHCGIPLLERHGKPVDGCTDYKPANLANASGGGNLFELTAEPWDGEPF